MFIFKCTDYVKTMSLWKDVLNKYLFKAAYQRNLNKTENDSIFQVKTEKY